MRDWPWRLDSWIIDGLCQPVCDRLAGWTTCYRIAAFLFTGAIVMCFLFCGMALISDQPLAVQALGCMSVALMAFVWFDAARRCRDIDTTAREGLIPVTRIIWFVIRVLYLAWGCALIAFRVLDLTAGGMRLRDILFTAGWDLATAGFYFAACRKNPPKRREARAPWLMRWREA